MVGQIRIRFMSEHVETLPVAQNHSNVRLWHYCVFAESERCF